MSGATRNFRLGARGLLGCQTASAIAMILALAAALPASAQTEPASGMALKMSGYLEAGGVHHRLSEGYGRWNGEFVRGVLQTDAATVWNGEVVNMQEFGDRGVLLTAGVSHTINEQWFASASAAGSSGGFFLPRLRMDVSLNRKWLEQKNLVTSLGFTGVDAKDGHRDRSILLSASYYFTAPWIIEGGIRFNRSDPGQVGSNTKYVAVTYGRDKQRLLSARYGFGAEAYQLIGSNTALANFDSHVWTLTWREWLLRDAGVQVRAESYRNPSYDRHGLELSIFKDF